MLLGIVLIISCSEDNLISNDKAEIKESINKILKEVEDSSDLLNESFEFTIRFEGNNNYWLGEKTRINKNTIAKNQVKPGSYQVDCYNGDGDLMWSQGYNNRDDAGAAVILCTNQGGCADICEIHARYFSK